jgi:methyltransferase (TIGR00027 family)
MQQGRASRTAEYMALFRALESARPADRRLFTDPFATAFLRPRLRLVVALSRLPALGGRINRFIDGRWPGARTSGIARTRFIDEAVRAAVDSGVEQAVILGAGFDARPYRLAALSGRTTFEVDHPSTSAAKQRVLAAVLRTPPAHVRFVPVDFDSERLESAMAAAGYDAGRRTLFIWEGVTNYLTEGAVDETLRWCARAAPGSTVVFTYVHRQVLDDPETFAGTGALFSTLGASQERWTFGLDPSRLESYLAERGLVLGEDQGAADYRARGYGPAAAAMRGYEFYRIAVAHVPKAGLTRRRSASRAGAPSATSPGS